VRRYSTLIAICAAVALAAIIVVASSATPRVDSGSRRDAAPTAAVTAHPKSAGIAPDGIVDTAAAGLSIAALERARAANPDSLRVVLNLGDAYFAAQRYDEAAAAYEAALARDPGHPSATVRMAMVWHERGDDDRALGVIDGVIAALPDHQEAHYDRALILFSRQEIAAAREAWARAAAIDPTSRLGRSSQDFVDLLSDGAGDDAP
jgi:tetratricopeptide (TPR) repeat protein